MTLRKPDYSTWAVRTARKAHICAKCGENIKAGSQIRHAGTKRIHARHVRTR